MHVQRALVAIIYFYQVRRSARLKSFSQNISPKLKLENFLLHETGKENTYHTGVSASYFLISFYRSWSGYTLVPHDNPFKGTSRLLPSCLETIV